MPEPTTPDANTITQDEVSTHLTYVEKALYTSRRDVRRRALLDGFFNFGIRFAATLGMLADHANHEGPFELIEQESQKLLQDWMLGHRLTKKADEADRRAQMALSILKEDESGQLGRLAAKCIMALPKDHPQRDIELVRQALLKYLAFARTNSNVDNQVLAMKEIVSIKLECLPRF